VEKPVSKFAFQIRLVPLHIGVPVAEGVVEFGSTRLHPHNLLTVQYVQKIMGAPQSAAPPFAAPC
jgi:hypothetical protein